MLTQNIQGKQRVASSSLMYILSAYLTACNRTGYVRLTDGANNDSGIVEYCSEGQYFSVCSMQGSTPEERRRLSKLVCREVMGTTVTVAGTLIVMQI